VLAAIVAEIPAAAAMIEHLFVKECVSAAKDFPAVFDSYQSSNGPVA